jgi:uncharacterized protein (DUF2267 family)
MVMKWDAFLAAVQERGQYSSRQEAERATRVVIALLGALNPLPAAEPLTAQRFVRATAAWIEGATEETAKWDVSAVLSVVADATDDELMRRVLLQLPPGYDLLFGRPQP